MKHNGGWNKTTSQYLFRSEWYDLRQDRVVLPSGDEISYTYVEHPGYAIVVPLFENDDVLVEKIYRYTLQQTLIEFPSGGLDGEDPRVAAARELREETGWHAGNLVLLGKHYGSSGISNEQYFIFLGTNLENRENMKREPTEQIELDRIPLSTLVDMVYKTELRDGPTALATLLTKKYVDERG